MNGSIGKWSRLLLVVSLGAAACGGSLGVLGQADFYYDCVDASDPYCDWEACEASQERFCEHLEYHNQEIPPLIAKDARFYVHTNRFTVSSTSPAMVSSEGGAFTAISTGRVALLARGSAGVYDYIYLNIDAPTTVRLTRLDAAGEPVAGRVELNAGEQVWIRAVPHGSRGALAGALPCTWEVEQNGEAVALRSDPGDNVAQLEGTVDGTATVRVTLGELAVTFVAQVGDPPCVGPCCVDSDCDPTDPDRGCCPDAYEQERDCAVSTVGATGECLLPCGSSQDCYLSTACDDAATPHCRAVPCGDPEQGWPGVLEGTCRVGETPEAGLGVCVGEPRVDPDRAGGLCREAGTLAPGQPCAVPSDPFSTPRWVPSCALGVCEGAPGETEGQCVGLCDWEQHYEVAFYGADATNIQLPCGPGRECVSSASLDSVTGLWQPGISRCLWSRTLDPESGVTTCSLVTGALVSATATGCASVLGDPSAECLPAPVDPAGDLIPWGTLIGACALPSPSVEPNRGVWEDCSDATAICPARTECTGESALVNAAFSTPRCLPYCDAVAHAPPETSCAALIEARNPGLTVVGTLGCVSFSCMFDDPAQCYLGGRDLHPTRLGVCQVLP